MIRLCTVSHMTSLLATIFIAFTPLRLVSILTIFSPAQLFILLIQLNSNLFHQTVRLETLIQYHIVTAQKTSVVKNTAVETFISHTKIVSPTTEFRTSVICYG